MKHKLLAMGFGLILFTWIAPAWAEIVVVVSAENSNVKMSRSVLTDLFLGRRHQFPDGKPVVPIDQGQGSQAYPEFYTEYAGQTPAQIRAHWSRLIFTGRGQPPRSVPDGQAMADAVADNPRAIGYLHSDHLDDRLRVVQIE